MLSLVKFFDSSQIWETTDVFKEKDGNKRGYIKLYSKIPWDIYRRMEIP